MVGAFALYSYAAYIGHTEWSEELLELRETRAELEETKEEASEQHIECLEEVTDRVDVEEMDDQSALEAAAGVVVCNRFMRIEDEAAEQLQEIEEIIRALEEERISRTLIPWR